MSLASLCCVPFPKCVVVAGRSGIAGAAWWCSMVVVVAVWFKQLRHTGGHWTSAVLADVLVCLGTLFYARMIPVCISMSAHSVAGCSSWTASVPTDEACFSVSSDAGAAWLQDMIFAGTASHRPYLSILLDKAPLLSRTHLPRAEAPAPAGTVSPICAGNLAVHGRRSPLIRAPPLMVAYDQNELLVVC